MADTVKVSLEVATKAAEIALKNFQEETKKADGFWNIFKGNLAANFAFDGLKNAGAAVIGFIGDVVDESAKAELSQKKLAIALQSAGLTSQQTFEDLKEYADELERTTTVSGEAAEASLAMLASLTTLDKEGLQQATTAAADLAATIGVDMDTATQLIIKGINGQTTAFQRYGIQVQKGANETQNFENVLQSLSKFQGAAVKSAETFTGAQEKLRNAQGNLFEAIGNLITQNPLVIAGYQKLTDVAIALSEFLEDNKDDMILFVNSMVAAVAIVGTVTAGILLFGGSLGGLATAFAVASQAAAVAWTIITGPIGIAVAAIIGLGAAIFATVKYWNQITIAVNEAIATTLEYAAVAAKVVSGKLAKSLQDEAQGFRDKAQATRDSIEVASQEAAARKEAEAQQEKQNQLAKESAIAKKEELEAYAKFAEGLVAQYNDISKANEQRITESQAQAELEQENLKMQLDNGLIGYYEYQLQRDAIDAEFYESRQALLLEQQEAETERLTLARQNNLISDTEFVQAKKQLDLNYANAKTKNDLEMTKKDAKNKQEQLKLEREFGQAKLQATSQVFGALAQITALGGEKMFKITKAFNLAEAITAGILSIQKAASAFPYPFNIPGIVAATAMSVANVARIASTKPTGYAGGGVIGGFQGATSGPDMTTIQARTGEMMLNGSQQRNLFDSINGGSLGGGDVAASVDRLAQAVQNQPIIVNIGGKTVVDTIRSELQSGRTFA